MHGVGCVQADGFRNTDCKLQHHRQRGDADGFADWYGGVAGDRCVRAAEPEFCGAAVEYGERGAAGDADQLGRCCADADCGADFERRLYHCEWVWEFAERALGMFAAGGVCAEECGRGCGRADAVGYVSQPDGDIERDGGCASWGDAVAGIDGGVRIYGGWADYDGADGDAYE